MSELTSKLRKGYGGAAGRFKQVEAYQAICDDAADHIDYLTSKVDELKKEILQLKERVK